MSKNLLYFLVINILIIFLVGWNSYIRFDDFKQHHIILSNESVESLSHDVSIFIKERRRLVKLFAQDHNILLEELINNPDNEHLKQAVAKQLLRLFPQYFTFTVADKNGTPYLVDFDNHIGELCINDISNFAKDHINDPQVHPGVDAYHFDIMTPLNISAKEIIFFVSFHADTLGDIIKTNEVPEHKLELILKNSSYLLEANSSGARDKTRRTDYRLNEANINAIRASIPVSNSRWHAIDSFRPQLLSTYLNKMFAEAGIFVLFSIIITSFFSIQIKKEEARRIIAENSKNEFLSIISHELRTPLTSIHGAISLLADQKIRNDSEKSQHMLDVAKRNCNQLLFLINEILDFRKIETGNLEYDFQRVELNSIIDEAIDGLDDYAKQYNVSIEYKRLDTPAYIQADAHRIIQVVNNLLSNAIKYGAPNDTILVKVALLDDFVRVSFQDHGPGIPDDFAEKIFDKFTQANISGKSTGSAGLGLNIAKTFIDAHNGHINFATSDKGTTFYFDLPLLREQ